MAQVYPALDQQVINLLEAFIAAEITKLQAQINDASTLAGVRILGIINLSYTSADRKTIVPVNVRFDMGQILNTATPTVVPADAAMNQAVPVTSIEPGQVVTA